MSATPPSQDLLLEEPFRVFFPLGVLATLVGVAPWLTFALGWTRMHASYSHGLLQIEAFEAAFATGFLMTVLPRFLETTPTRRWEMFVSLLLCLGLTLALGLEQWRAGQWLFLALMAHLLLFGARRMRSRGDDPPPFFAFIPVGLVAGLVGAAAILWPLEGFTRLGENLVQQGVMLALVLAIGSHLGPRLLYGHRDFPETTTPAAHRRRAWLLALGGVLLASFFVEAAGAVRTGIGVRAAVISGYLLLALRIHRPPVHRLVHVHLLRFSFLCLALGLWVATAAPPELRTAALHLTFLGGFGLMTFIIATRVVTGHGGFDDLWVRNRAAVIVPLGLIALAMPVRLAAEAVPSQYVVGVAASAALWLLGVAVWGVIFIPKMSPRHVAPD